MANIGVHFTGPALHGVTSAISGAGHEIYVAADMSRVQSLLDRTAIDAWIVEAHAEDVLSHLLPIGSFVLPADNIPEVSERKAFNTWMGALLTQLEVALLQPPVVASINGRERWQQVQAVWLLAGSAGATEAVQQFLNAFSEPPPVAFIYAQHLDPQLQHQLERFTLQNALFSLAIAQGSHTLEPGRIVMVSPQSRVALHEFGRITSTREAWNAEHTPDINEMLVLLSAFRASQCGVIVFSGMGDDGSAALPTFDASGGRIWAQAPASALSPAMPSAAIATGLVEKSDEPAALAAALEALYTPVENSKIG